MNSNRIIAGGLLAGVAINIIEWFSNSVLMSSRYMALQDKGAFLAEPRYPFMFIWVITMLLVGIGLAWFYAVARARLGKGPMTAVLVGLVIGLIAFVPTNFTLASWSSVGRFVPLAWMITGLVDTIVGTLVAGAVYRE